MIVVALGPMVLAWWGWPVAVTQYKAWQWRRAVAMAEPAEAMRLIRQAELLALVGESWDTMALDTIAELSEIGDENALPLLEEKLHAPIVDTGKFGAALYHAMSKIKDRTEAEKKLTPATPSRP